MHLHNRSESHNLRDRGAVLVEEEMSQQQHGLLDMSANMRLGQSGA